MQLVVALWEHPGYRGRKRVFVDGISEPLHDTVHFRSNAVPDLSRFGFSAKTSAIGVHPGPGYATPTVKANVTFFEKPFFEGLSLTLPVGAYANLAEIAFNDRISSMVLHVGSEARPAHGIAYPATHDVVTLKGPAAAAITNVPLVVELFASPLSVVGPPNDTTVPLDGQKLIVVEDCESLSNDFGSEWNDRVVAIRVSQGPTFNNHRLRVFQDPRFTGFHQDFGPGYFRNLPDNFAKKISSMRFVRD